MNSLNGLLTEYETQRDHQDRIQQADQYRMAKQAGQPTQAPAWFGRIWGTLMRTPAQPDTLTLVQPESRAVAIRWVVDQ